MKNLKFLDSVARFLVGRDMGNLTVVSPNKRSAMFLRRALQRAAAGRDALFMPRLATMRALVERLDPGRRTPDRWEQQMALFSCFRQIRRDAGEPVDAEYFERFAFWGDIILSDFDEIDRSMANAAELYTNLRRLDEIKAYYMTEEQREAVTRILGHQAAPVPEADRFWEHADPGADCADDSARRRFLKLYEMLPRLYCDFKALLASKGCATAGMRARTAADNIRRTAMDTLRGSGRRYAVVGMGVPDRAEQEIFDRLQEAGIMEFFWDLGAESDETARMAPGQRSIAELARRYPMPAGYECPMPTAERTIQISGVASAMEQAQLAAAEISRLVDEGEVDPDNAIDVAVVLPDASLLLPLSLALPPQLRAVNVTMQLPWNSTPFATLLRSIILMQQRGRNRGGEYAYFYTDILDVLSHPHIRLIAAREAGDLRSMIMDEGVFNVTARHLAQHIRRLDFMFRPVPADADTEQVYDYLKGLITGLLRLLGALTPVGPLCESIELQCLRALAARLDDLKRLIAEYDVAPGRRMLFTFFERLLATGMLGVNGTPLRGLQVMGVLETRALDFDHIIYLSMNERTFPQRQQVRTMIPNALRRAYGLPVIESADTEAGYIFYRSIARARRVTLLYDSRSGIRSGGEMSRFLTQLIYSEGRLRPGTTLRIDSLSPSGEQPSSRLITVRKAQVRDKVLRFTRPGGPNLSASALKTYMSCPLRFYLQNVCGFREEDLPTEYMTASQTGNIMHRAMRLLYEQFEVERGVRGLTVDADSLTRMAAGTAIRDKIIQAIGEERYHDPATPVSRFDSEARLVLSITEQQIRSIIDAEKNCFCRPSFEYLGGEIEIAGSWAVTAGHSINFRMIIDRIDRTSPDSLRFIDYKTGGSDDLTSARLWSLFDGSHNKQALFQLMLYAMAYTDMTGCTASIDGCLMTARQINRDGNIKPTSIEKKPLCDPEIQSRFRALFEDLIDKIFDETTDFTQAPTDENCGYCPFNAMCGRMPTERKDYGF